MIKSCYQKPDIYLSKIDDFVYNIFRYGFLQRKEFNRFMNDEYRLRMEAQDLTKQPPTEEPERQYYFMKKCQEIVKKKSEEMGRPLTFSLTSFGCPKV